MTGVEVFVDPSCPWAWITAQWVREVAPKRDLAVTWRSYCLEIRDDYDVAPTVAPERRDAVIAGHAFSHRMLRIFEAARARNGESAVDALVRAVGPAVLPARRDRDDDALLAACIAACRLDRDLIDAAGDEKWDTPIVEAMEVAYAFGGPKTQTPTIVVRADPPHGFKGPVMAPAPTGDAAVRMWDAIEVLSAEPGFFEFTRPRVNRPLRELTASRVVGDDAAPLLRGVARRVGRADDRDRGLAGEDRHRRVTRIGLGRGDGGGDVGRLLGRRNGRVGLRRGRGRRRDGGRRRRRYRGGPWPPLCGPGRVGPGSSTEAAVATMGWICTVDGVGDGCAA